jgi:hypothetical protein
VTRFHRNAWSEKPGWQEIGPFPIDDTVLFSRFLASLNCSTFTVERTAFVLY